MSLAEKLYKEREVGREEGREEVLREMAADLGIPLEELKAKYGKPRTDGVQKLELQS